METGVLKSWIASVRDPAAPNKVLHISGGPGKQALVWVLGQALEKPVACLPEITITENNADILEASLLSVEDVGSFTKEIAHFLAAVVTGTPYIFCDHALFTPAQKVPIVVVSHGRGGPLLAEGVDFSGRTVEFHLDPNPARVPDVVFWKEALGVAP